MLAEHNGDVSNHRDICSHTAHDVFLAVEVVLAPGIQLNVIGQVVVALKNKPDASVSFGRRKSMAERSTYLGQEHVGVWCGITRGNCQYSSHFTNRNFPGIAPGKTGHTQ